MNITGIRNYFAPAPHLPRLPEEQIKIRYPKFRWSILESTFIGYAMFYLVRNNFNVVAPDMQAALHYDRFMIGNIVGITAITYGIGKFLMGAVSDRSDSRKFMAFGLLLTAICNIIFGSVSNYTLHLSLWGLNGFVQGMGWPPCGRSIGHWFSVRERGTVFSTWNTSHNFGGAITGPIAAFAVHYFGWRNAFYFPAVLAIIGAIYLFWRLRDTPQSVGLPPIEEYKNDFTEEEKIHGTHEREFTYKELFVKFVLTNKFIWLLAFANLFAYVVRYSMLDWGCMYLRESKGCSDLGGGWAIFALEFGGIPSTILFGWLSDKIGGRRGKIAVLCMLPIVLAFIGIIINPVGRLWLDRTLLFSIGFFIYPVINLIVIIALDLTSKKAIGTAAGFIGLFGYIGRSAQGFVFGAMADHYCKLYGTLEGWKIVLWSIVACAFIAIILLAFTWKLKPKA
ncbi:MAG: MFS transporter [Planctomycetes bacterium GWF2_42_9]|nr:MAG: MFS transporter [Planctomycetes bacterium GWF2_42_9]HAL45081.1 MFS transporter [Phycisphaerales bacterium]